MLRSELKIVKILSEPSIKRRQSCNPLIGKFITVAGAPLIQQKAMSQQEGDDEEVGYEHEYEYDEDESEDESANNATAVKPMNSIWDCEHLCIKMHEDEFGKLISGWTCAYSPCPGNVGGYVFQKSVNAKKCLCTSLSWQGNMWLFVRGLFPIQRKWCIKPCTT